MPRLSSLLTACLLLLAAICPNLPAATITYTLDLSSPGTFTLSATASADDNSGIFFYGIPLLGDVLTLDHRSPITINSANFSPAGFSDLRTPNSSAPLLNPIITASQSLFATPDNLIHGIGQEASSFAARGIAP